MIQDRIRQKSWLAGAGLPGRVRFARSPHATKASRRSRRSAAASSSPRVAGTTDAARFASTRPDGAAAAPGTSLGERPCLVEQFLDIASEISMLVARAGQASGRGPGTPSRFRHRSTTTSTGFSIGPSCPRSTHRPALGRPTAIARGIATTLGIEGLIAVEMFILHDGRLLVNELAPRPHNTFHSTERGVRHQSVRAARARRVRSAAREHGSASARGDRESARRSVERRHSGLRRGPRGYRRCDCTCMARRPRVPGARWDTSRPSAPTGDEAARSGCSRAREAMRRVR